MFENDTTHALRANFVENWKVIRCHSNDYFFHQISRGKILIYTNKNAKYSKRKKI